MFGDGSTMTPIRVNSVQETGNYHKDFFSYFEVEFLISRQDSMKIYKNQLNTTVHLIKTAYKYRTPSVDPTNMVIDQSATDTYHEELESQIKELDIVMIPIFSHDSFPTNLPEEEWENDKTAADPNPESGISNRLMDTVPISINMVLYSQSALVTNKGANINAVLKNCLPATALAWAISSSGVQKAIVDTPDNNYQEDFIILLPYNLRNTIHMIQNNYGLYKDSLVAFLDFDTLYVLNKFGSAHDFANGDKPFTVINFHDPKKTPIFLSTLDESNNAYQFHVSSNPNPIDIRTLAGELVGDQIIATNLQMAIGSIVSKDGKFVGYNPAAAAIDRQVDSHSASGNKIRFEYDETNNMFLLSSFMRELSVKQSMSFHIPNVYTQAFKANKIITLNFPQSALKQQKYGGNYTIIDTHIGYLPIKPTSGSEMVASATVNVQTLSQDHVSS